jgi:catechol 2,3-dioxygenase-like lactoylglutathione lyase family enzyme
VFDHVTIRVPDLAAAQRFYELAFDAIDFRGTPAVGENFLEWNDFSIAQATSDAPPTRGLHIAFVARSRGHVDAFWDALTGAGYQDDGPPGPRPQYSKTYYGAFVLDPGSNNSIEAVHHNNVRTDGGAIDHLWIRVAHVGAARRFYETIAAQAGIRLKHDSPERVQFAGDSGSFSLVDGTPTEYVHLAFRAPDHATVDEFHRVATQAGYTDNGAPGERPIYHPGYYGAYVLDPNGHNVEAVFHDRGSQNEASESDQW